MSYIENLLALCRRVDGSMSEEDPVPHVRKGIAPFAFQALALQNDSRVQDVIAKCKRLEDLQSMRVQPAMWGEGFSKDLDLRAMIRLIIREELEGHVSHNFPHNSHQPPSTTAHVAPHESLVPGLRDLNRDEPAVIKSDPLYKAEHSCTSPAASASTLPQIMQASTPLTHVGRSCVDVAHISAVSSTPHSYSLWRPLRPVCYYCGIRGHISRFCRRCQQDERYIYNINSHRDTPEGVMDNHCFRQVVVALRSLRTSMTQHAHNTVPEVGHLRLTAGRRLFFALPLTLPTGTRKTKCSSFLEGNCVIAKIFKSP